MDSATNAQVARLFHDLAERFALATRPMTARFTDGSEGYSISLIQHQGTPNSQSVIAFYNDDKFGPRYIGKAGARVPAHKVIPYVIAASEQPDLHPSALNSSVLG